MRRLISFVGLAALALAGQGCGSCGSKAGFTLAYHLPPTISQNAIVSPQQTAYYAQGLASCAVAGSQGLYAAEARPLALQTVEQAPVPRRAMAPADTGGCQTLQDVCDRIDKGFDRLAASLERLPRAMGQQKPMALPKED